MKINYVNVNFRYGKTTLQKVEKVLPTKKTSDKNPDENNNFMYTLKEFDKEEKHIDIRI